MYYYGKKMYATTTLTASITINQVEGANITVNKTTALVGETLKISIEFETFYSLKNFLHNGKVVSGNYFVVEEGENVISAVLNYIPAITINLLSYVEDYKSPSRFYSYQFKRTSKNYTKGEVVDFYSLVSELVKTYHNEDYYFHQIHDVEGNVIVENNDKEISLTNLRGLIGNEIADTSLIENTYRIFFKPKDKDYKVKVYCGQLRDGISGIIPKVIDAWSFTITQLVPLDLKVKLTNISIPKNPNIGIIDPTFITKVNALKSLLPVEFRMSEFKDPLNQGKYIMKKANEIGGMGSFLSYTARYDFIEEYNGQKVMIQTSYQKIGIDIGGGGMN